MVRLTTNGTYRSSQTDALVRPTAQYTPDTLSHQTATTYDENSKVTQTTNALGVSTTNTYGTGQNSNDVVEQRQGSSGPTTTTQYRTSGNVHDPESTTDAQGHTTRYAY